MKSFARATKLPNIGGRGDYISNPDRQEQIMAKSATVDWEPYQEYERSHQKTAIKNNEGREIIVALPNEWANLPEQELWSRAHFLAVTAIGKSTDMQWAVHWNKARTDLHLHVVYSERQREENPGRWDRNIYLTAEGKVARTKADRAKDENGKELPPVHRKGELKEGFSSKDPKYTSRAWLKETKERLQSQMTARWGVTFEKPAPLHEYHEGKGKEAPKIRAKNEAVRATNKNILELIDAYPNLSKDRTYAAIKREAVKTVKQGHVAYFEKRPEGLRLKTFDLDTWGKIKKQTVSRQPEQAPMAPEPPKIPFADLLEAQRELYRQTFALHDKRKPLDMVELRRSADIRAAAHELTSALDSSARALERERSCGFFQLKEKKAAQIDRRAADRRAEGALETLGKLGVNTRIGGIAPSLIYHNREDFKSLSARAEEQAAAIESEAYRVARPKDALRGSQEATRAAESRFKSLCLEIPPEQRRAAKTALETHENEYRPKGRSSFADTMAHTAVFGVRSRMLDDQPKERQREKIQNRGPER